MVKDCGFLEVIFPDGERYWLLVRGVSIAHGYAALHRMMERGEAACFGARTGMDEAADQAAAFRELPTDEMLAAVKALPWGLDIAAWMVREEERITERDLFECILGTPAGFPRRPFIADLLSKYGAADWAAATITRAALLTNCSL